MPTSIGQDRGTRIPNRKDEFRFAHLQRAGRPPLADRARPPSAGGVCVTNRAGPQFSKKKIKSSKQKQARHLQPAGSASLTAQVPSFQKMRSSKIKKTDSPSSAGGVYVTNRVGPYFQNIKTDSSTSIGRGVHPQRTGSPTFSGRGLRH